MICPRFLHCHSYQHNNLECFSFCIIYCWAINTTKWVYMLLEGSPVSQTNLSGDNMDSQWVLVHGNIDERGIWIPVHIVSSIWVRLWSWTNKVKLFSMWLLINFLDSCEYGIMWYCKENTQKEESNDTSIHAWNWPKSVLDLDDSWVLQTLFSRRHKQWSDDSKRETSPEDRAKWKSAVLLVYY